MTYDRDYVVLLSDWSDESPQQIYSNLKKDGHYYNRRRHRTTTDLWRDVRAKGIEQTWRERHPWNFAGMSDRDVSDVTGYTYSYLINGQTPEDNWTALFAPGEIVRLRFINASAMTIFDLRIPDLDMTVVSADGQNIQPVRVDEFRLGTGETYDVVVKPSGDRAYTLFAQAIDRGGYARGTLTPAQNLSAEVPPWTQSQYSINAIWDSFVPVVLELLIDSPLQKNKMPNWPPPAWGAIAPSSTSQQKRPWRSPTRARASKWSG